MKKLRWFIARNLVRLANKTIPDDDYQYILEVVVDVDTDIERDICNKIRENYNR